MAGNAARFWDKWGHYLLAALCVLVILFSGLWTRAQWEKELPHAQALNDTSQRLGQTAAPPEPALILVRPCAGEVVCPFSRNPVYFADLGLWMVHLAVDFAVEEGDAVLSMADGIVERADGEARIRHADGTVAVYRGCGEITVRTGQRVSSGQMIGRTGAPVPLEGVGRLCVSLIRDGVPVEFGNDWLTNP